VAVADGKVYASKCDMPAGSATAGLVMPGYALTCFDAFTGTQMWTIEGLSVAQPVVAYGNLYFADFSYAYCIGESTPAKPWAFGFAGNIDQPRVAVGQSGPEDLSNPKWVFETGDEVSSSPAVVDGKVYIGSHDRNWYCLDAYTGDKIWNFTVGFRVMSSAAVVGGRVFTGADDGYFYCLDAENGTKIWEAYAGGLKTNIIFPQEWQPRSSPIIVGSRLYVGALDGKVYCLNTSDGDELWTYTTGGPIGGSPAYSNGVIYIVSTDSYMYALDANNGAFKWKTFALNLYVGVPTYCDLWACTTPTVADGVVYVGSCDNKIYAFGPPFIWHFNDLFRLNSVRMIYPSEQTPKPLNCASAMVSDWLSSAFIYTKLETVVEGTDTDAAFVDQATGKPLGAAGSGLISFGGPIVNPVVAYAESGETPTGDRAPIKFYQNAETCYFQRQDGTSITGANLPASVINSNMDMFVIEVYQDSDGRNVMLCYGFGWQGTYAAGKYFDTEIYPNLSLYAYSWIIVKWEDTNANGFVNTAADGDTYTVIATGQI